MKAKSTFSSKTLRALSDMLLPVARTLIKRDLAIGSILFAAKLAYVRAAQEDAEDRRTRPNISQISVVTGLTRKDVASLLKLAMQGSDLEAPGKVLEQRALRVLRGWVGDPLYQTSRGRPAPLALNGSAGTFASLVRAYGGDVSTSAVRKQLERMGVVRRNRQGHLKLVRSFTWSASEADVIEFAGRVGDFAAAAGERRDASCDAPVFAGFRESPTLTDSQAAMFERIFARRAVAFLESVDEWNARQGINLSRSESSRSDKVVRLGIYFLQRESGLPRSESRRRPKAR